MNDVLHSFYVVLTDPAPPSVNHMYFTNRYGQRVLTKEGVRFKSAMTSAVVEQCMFLPWKRAVDAVYDERATVCLVIVVHGPILNGSWKPKSQTEKGNRRSPYKKKDATSYIKVVEDAVAEGTGIDDSANMDVRTLKWPGPYPYIEVFYEVLRCKIAIHVL